MDAGSLGQATVGPGCFEWTVPPGRNHLFVEGWTYVRPGLRGVMVWVMRERHASCLNFCFTLGLHQLYTIAFFGADIVVK